MKIFLAADHRGFQLKEALRPWLQSLGHEVEDCGNTQLDPQDDFVDFTRQAAQRLLTSNQTQSPSPTLQSTAIAICGSGIGVSIAANRFLGIRCALCMSQEHAIHARKNDHANMLALASEYISPEEAQGIIQAFLSTEESLEEKYLRRTLKLDELNSI
jgi:ribose 5-phosphate isomerase B